MAPKKRRKLSKKTKPDEEASKANTENVVPAAEAKKGGAMEAHTSTASSSSKRCNAGLSVEMSRSRIQARTGLVGLGQGKAFSFSSYGGQDGAYKAAEAWLKHERGKRLSMA